MHFCSGVDTVDGMAADATFASDYANFVRDMVHGEKTNFETAMTTVKALAEPLKKGQA